MKALILTSSLDTNYKNENGIKVPQNFGNENGILDVFKKYLDKYENFLFVASSNEFEITDMYASVMIKSFEMTLPFKNYNILDMRSKDRAKELVENADLIVLCGGHVPTQNKLFQQLNLKELMRNTKAIVCGCSAGSMNTADTVYCPPELEGEGLDLKFKRFLPGLGLTHINVFPHFDLIKDEFVDGLNHLNDFILPDSHKTPIVCLNERSFVLVCNNEVHVFGESYLAIDGELKLICKENDIAFLNI